MILDKTALAEIRRSWNGVEVLRGRLQVALLASFASGGSAVILVADSAHNLPFVHAYGVFNDVLEQLAKEGRFQCGSIFLGKLLAASEHKVPWQDFSLIKEGANLRNAVAHRGEVLPRAKCWKYIDGVRQQLVAWGVLDAPTETR